MLLIIAMWNFLTFFLALYFPCVGLFQSQFTCMFLSTILHNIHCTLNLSRKSSICSRFFTKIRSFYNEFFHNCYLNTLQPAEHVYCSGKKLTKSTTILRLHLTSPMVGGGRGTLSFLWGEGRGCPPIKGKISSCSLEKVWLREKENSSPSKIVFVIAETCISRNQITSFLYIFSRNGEKRVHVGQGGIHAGQDGIHAGIILYRLNNCNLARFGGSRLLSRGLEVGCHLVLVRVLPFFLGEG